MRFHLKIFLDFLYALNIAFALIKDLREAHNWTKMIPWNDIITFFITLTYLVINYFSDLVCTIFMWSNVVLFHLVIYSSPTSIYTSYVFFVDLLGVIHTWMPPWMDIKDS